MALERPLPKSSCIDDRALTELVDAIRQHGLIQPIAAKPRSDGRFTVVAGHRRLAAFKRLREEASTETARQKYAAISAVLKVALDDAQLAAHTTGTLLLKAGAPLAIVQRILRHSSPTITAMVYGHLDLGDMTDALGLLSFTPRPTDAADELSARRGAPVVRKNQETDSEPDAAEDKTPQRRGLEDSGPSWIRTRDQSVMSRQL